MYLIWGIILKFYCVFNCHPNFASDRLKEILPEEEAQFSPPEVFNNSGWIV